MEKFNYGWHTIPVTLIQQPEERYHAREAQQANVDALARSLLQLGSLNEHVEVVMFVGVGKPLPPKVGFKPPVSVDALKNRSAEGYFTVVGDHTQRAMNQLHANFSKNPNGPLSLSLSTFVRARLMFTMC